MKSDATNATVALLMTVTERLIMEKGASRTTIRDIMGAAGLSMGAIYHYLNNKEQLYGLILQDKIDGIDRQFNDTVCRSELGDLGGPLRAILNGFFAEFIRGDTAAQRIVLYLLSHRESASAVLLNFQRKWAEVAARWIEVGQQAHAIPSTVDAKQAGATVTTYVLGLFFEHSLGVHGDLDQAFAVIARLLQGGIPKPERNE